MVQNTSGEWRRHLETATRSGTRDRGRLTEIVVPGLTILAHADPERVGDRVALPSLAAGGSARLSRLEPDFTAPTGGVGRPLADPRLSRTPVMLSSEPRGSVRIDCSAVRTRIRAAGSDVEIDRSLSIEQLAAGVPLLLGDRVTVLFHLLEPPIQRDADCGLVGESTAVARLRQEIHRVADMPFPVLLRGESGTGKELVARAIHDAGPRRGRIYLSVNVGAIPASLATAELFGAAKGAYTGARQARDGYFQRADGGTLFLDEIGEAPPEIQVLLLRALESNEVQPVGAAAARKVDVRLVCATDADLESAVESGEFRSPLLHRLAGYELALPPLRGRRDDIGRLLYHFLREELRSVGEERRLADPGPHGRPWMSAELVSRLAAYDWPGNVRQLKNVARQLVVASRGDRQVTVPAKVEQMLRRGDRSEEEVAQVLDERPPPATETPIKPAYRKPGEVGDEELLAALKAERWNLKQAAKRLGVSRTTLYALVDQCPAVRKASELRAEEIQRSIREHAGNVDAVAFALEVSQRGLLMRMKELGLR